MTVCSVPACNIKIANMRKTAKPYKTKIEVGTSVTVKVGEIDEKMKDGKSRRVRKDMVGCLAHISSVLVFSHFWRFKRVSCVGLYCTWDISLMAQSIAGSI